MVYKNKERLLKDRKIYQKEKRRTDINYRLADILRSRLNGAIRGNFKSGSAVSDLGCSIDYLKKYLESQFKDRMSWENQGDWHIDHQIPLSIVDLQDRESFLQVTHYTNLQPLWAIDNLRKSNKIINYAEE